MATRISPDFNLRNLRTYSAFFPWFYVVAAIVIGLVLKYTDDSDTASPAGTDEAGHAAYVVDPVRRRDITADGTVSLNSGNDTNWITANL